MDGGVTRWSVCLVVRCSLEDQTEGKTNAGGHWLTHTDKRDENSTRNDRRDLHVRS